jgi:hypothetical protein
MSGQMLQADIHTSTYENCMAICPRCRHDNIYNRRDDLETTRPVFHREVTCQNKECKSEFIISDDLINPAHQMILFGLYEFLNQKKYMQTILAVAQAYEVFFGHALNVYVLYRPYSRDWHRLHDGNSTVDEATKLYSEVNPETFNHTSDQLFEKTKRYAFDDMRHLFLSIQVNQPELTSLMDSKAWIEELPECPQKRVRVSKKDIGSISNRRLKVLLEGFLTTDINELRNKVIHKTAYRPTGDETRAHVKEAEKLIYASTSRLKLGGTMEWYINGRDR